MAPRIIVSSFSNVKDVSPRNVYLLQWLEGNEALNALVDQIRQEPDKDRRSELKKQLPAITPSGIFETRRASGLIKHSGLIALDFDNCDPLAAKDVLRNIANVLYAGLSVSGKGVWALLPISEPYNHRRHFDALRVDFENLGLKVDPACSDVSRLRFYSYDNEPIFNFEAKPYCKLSIKKSYKRQLGQLRTGDSLEQLIDYIVSIGQDITAHYHDWLSIGGALSCIYGESGREKFHLLSQFYDGYNPRETDKQYNACLRNRPNFSQGVIFSVAQKYGILLKSSNNRF